MGNGLMGNGKWVFVFSLQINKGKIKEKCRRQARNEVSSERANQSCSFPVVGNYVSQINNPLRVTPFVIIPSNNLHQVIAHNHSQGRVDS